MGLQYKVESQLVFWLSQSVYWIGLFFCGQTCSKKKILALTGENSDLLITVHLFLVSNEKVCKNPTILITKKDALNVFTLTDKKITTDRIFSIQAGVCNI